MNLTLNSTPSLVEEFSQEHEKWLRELIRFVDGYLVLFFAIFGSFFNTLSMIVFRRMNRGKLPLAQYYLIIFLVCQTATLCLCLLMYCLPTLIYGDTQVKGFYAYVIFVAHAFSGPCFIIITWIVLALTIERYFALQKPFAYRAIADPSRVKRIIAGVIIAAFIFSIPRLFDYKLGTTCDVTPSDNSSHKDNTTECYAMVIATELLSNQLYWDIYHVWLVLIFVTFVPSMVLLILTLRISWFLHVNSLNRRTLNAHRPDGDKSNCSIKGERESNVMLVMLMAKFALSDPLPMLESLIGAVAPEQSPAMMALIVSVASFMMVFCSSINFFMFYLSGKHFRKECKRMLFSKDSAIESSGFSANGTRYSQQTDGLPPEEITLAKDNVNITALPVFLESGFIKRL